MTQPQNPSAVIGLELYDRMPGGDRRTGWFAVSYDYDDSACWIQFEHGKFQPWDIRLSNLEIVIDLCSGKQYLLEKA